MKFLSKVKRGSDDEDDDELDLEDQPEPEDAGEEEDPSGGGLFRKLFRRQKGDADDSDDLDGDEDDTTGLDEDPPVQRVRLEGIADVRPVGPSAGAMTPTGDPPGSEAATEATTEAVAPSTNQSVGSGPEASAKGTVTQASPGDSPQEPESAPEQDGAGGASGSLDFSLSDIFEEAATADENLKDLSDSQEDIRAEDLAGELRELLAELER